MLLYTVTACILGAPKCAEQLNGTTSTHEKKKDDMFLQK
jgi:hypothetical protein